jgi:hypothetical protein
MMMVSNSKPGAVGTSRSQPDAGVYPHSASVNPRQDFVPPIGPISASRVLLRLATATQKHSSRRLLFFLRGMLAIQNT